MTRKGRQALCWQASINLLYEYVDTSHLDASGRFYEVVFYERPKN